MSTHCFVVDPQCEIQMSLRILRGIATDALSHALHSVLPASLMRKYVSVEHPSKELKIGELRFPFSSVPSILVLGGGKATANMCQSLIDVLQNVVPIYGAINVPYGQEVSETLRKLSNEATISVQFCAHPVPDRAGVEGVELMLEKLQRSSHETLVLALISGGGSALMPYPAEGLTLEHVRAVVQLLLRCGAAIHEINTVRKHLSGFSGGQLARRAHPRRLVGLIISDVVGDDLQTIASGPTVPDRTTFGDAYHICEKYGLLDALPPEVRTRLERGKAGEIEETPKPGDRVFERVANFIIGSAATAADAAKARLEQGPTAHCRILTNALDGEAREYGRKLLLDVFPNVCLPLLQTYPSLGLIATGEFTVTLRGKGKGGRNQEMLLAFMREWERLEAGEHSGNDGKIRQLLSEYEFVIIGAAFDGIEGNSGAMGAVVDSSSLSRVQKLGLSLQHELDNNNSAVVFEALGDQLVTGHTGTNVNDMLMILLARKQSLSAESGRL